VPDPKDPVENRAAAHEAPPAAVEEVLEALATPGLGPVTLRRLLNRFNSWAQVRRASVNELAECGVKRDAITAIRAGRLAYDPAEEMAKARTHGVHILTFTDAEFPAALRNHEDLPPLLYIKGDLLERDALALAVVGARRASLYGRMHAERFGFELAQAGFTVVSGLAQGIDAAAHGGALKGNGRTVAVLGSGLGRIYPPEHRELAERIARQGAVVSELPMDTAPSGANFPPRNRIIAALSLGVLVVEASRTSGSLITARFAGELGKEVFAIPGDIGRPQTRGTHRLIRDGAKLVETVDDILDELGPLTQPLCVREGEPPIPDPRALVLNPHERAIYDLLDSSPKDIDLITRESGLSPANAASTLLVLELRRLAVQMPGKLYVRAGTLQRT
jgi:DNA processing protein